MHRLFRRLKGEKERPAAFPVVSAEGRLRLDPISPEEVSLVEQWFSDFDSSRLAFGVDAEPELLSQLIQEYVDDLQKDRAGVLMVRLAQQTLEQTALGFVRYKLYRKSRRCTARVGIMVGTPGQRNQGLGREAMGALLAYLFGSRRVDRVELDTADFNLQAQRCFYACGFELLRETEVIDLHNRWTERRKVMRLERARWLESTTSQPQS